jgi:phosphohistidine phosphatase
VRARQTAELAVDQGVAEAFSLSDALRPGGDAGSLLEPPAAGGEGDLPRRLGLVGHEPQLSELAARLVGAAPGGIGLRKAGVILLEIPAPVVAPGPWGVSRLIGLLSPRILLR